MKPIKILFFSDTHLGFDYPLNPRVEKRRRGFDFFQHFRNILNTAIREEYDLVIHGGDLFFRSKIPINIIDMVYLDLFDFAKAGIPIFIVPGNHERSKLPDSLLISLPEINIYDKPMTYTLEIQGKKICLSGFPFVKGNIRNSFPEILRKTNYTEQKGDLNLLIVHHPLDGASVGPVNFTFRGREDTINPSEIPAQFHAVLAGHIHRRQIHEYNGTPIIFSGSIEKTSFAEMNETKGYVKLTFDDMLHYEFVDIPTRPMHIITIPWEIEQNDVIPYLLDEISLLDRNSIIRINMNGKKHIPENRLRQLIPPTINIEQGFK
ncbi:MAG: metallophosphoesterase [Candidatus Cloacimonetes bacterium]|nr:metallophosphoesterase [Candidatus Cloacimonadota bacterium]